ncbi:MAG: hypothetical protein JXB33_11000 [Clostridia bacterium]|nr:hypothetical protein [Clostridia bacterium]
MYILQNDSHENLFNFLMHKGVESIARSDSMLDSIKTKAQWEIARKELLDTYLASYPLEIFEKRPVVKPVMVSEHKFNRYRIENYLFESFPGWFVNATVYLPLEKGKYPGIVCPTGHSSKKFKNYTGSAQLLAMSGYIAVSFDPPGMQGEHAKGNDHFEDGVRGYLSGFWSQAFFVMDAIRCMDYLETRDDVETGPGFGMAGISGGGTTSLHAPLLDQRVSCIAPVCCISDQRETLFVDRYTFCPEGIGCGHLSGGIDYRSVISLNAPRPCLIISGARDEVLDAGLARRTVEKAKGIYRLFDSGDIEYYCDEAAGHEFTPAMVNEILGFFDKHLKKSTGVPVKYQYTYDDLEYPDESMVLCHPEDTASMYTANLQRFRNVPARADMDPDKLAGYLGIDRHAGIVEEIDAGNPELRWAHSFGRKVYCIDEYTQIPVLTLDRHPVASMNAVIYADDDNKWSKMENDGFLTRKAAFLSRTPVKGEASIISVDISGTGELSIGPESYDLSNWGRADRLCSYLAITLGTSITALRTRDFLAVLQNVVKSGKFERITAAGKGISALPVLLASYIFEKCDRVVLENLPVSFESMALHVPNKYCPTSVIFDAPGKFEIFEIANMINGLTLVNPVHADGRIMSEQDARRIYNDNVRLIFNEEGLIPEYL